MQTPSQILCSDLLSITAPTQQVVVSLGSNHQSILSFERAMAGLSGLGVMNVSTIHVSADYTHKTSKTYHNACALLVLDECLGVAELKQRLCQIEYQCGANNHLKRQHIVAMDIDVLALLVDGVWHISQRRLPFKAHELVGLRQVATFLEGCFNASQSPTNNVI